MSRRGIVAAVVGIVAARFSSSAVHEVTDVVALLLLSTSRFVAEEDGERADLRLTCEGKALRAAAGRNPKQKAGWEWRHGVPCIRLLYLR